MGYWLAVDLRVRRFEILCFRHSIEQKELPPVLSQDTFLTLSISAHSSVILGTAFLSSLQLQSQPCVEPGTVERFNVC